MNDIRTYFKILDHTADLGIRVFGKDAKDLFERAAYSLMDILVKGRKKGPPDSISLVIKGLDLNDLMVNWLGEILYLFFGKEKVVNAVTIQSISETRLEATLELHPLDLTSHEILSEIKAVTYHQIEVKEEQGCWEARIFFDL